MTDLLITSQVARILRRTPETVRIMERTGRLKAIRAGHVRLFEREEVESLAKEIRRDPFGVRARARKRAQHEVAMS